MATMANIKRTTSTGNKGKAAGKVQQAAKATQAQPVTTPAPTQPQQPKQPSPQVLAQAKAAAQAQAAARKAAGITTAPKPQTRGKVTQYNATNQQLQAMAGRTCGAVGSTKAQQQAKVINAAIACIKANGNRQLNGGFLAGIYGHVFFGAPMPTPTSALATCKAKVDCPVYGKYYGSKQKVRSILRHAKVSLHTNGRNSQKTYTDQQLQAAASLAAKLASGKATL